MHLLNEKQLSTIVQHILRPRWMSAWIIPCKRSHYDCTHPTYQTYRRLLQHYIINLCGLCSLRDTQTCSAFVSRTSHRVDVVFVGGWFGVCVCDVCDMCDVGACVPKGAGKRWGWVPARYVVHYVAQFILDMFFRFPSPQRNAHTARSHLIHNRTSIVCGTLSWRFCERCTHYAALRSTNGKLHFAHICAHIQQTYC